MFRTVFTYTHPTDVMPFPRMDMIQREFRDNFIIWAENNGLVNIDTDLIDTDLIGVTTKIHTVTWADEATYDAFISHWGQPYTDFFEFCNSDIAAEGGELVTTTETI
jgi:hypothetical protein